MRNVIYQYWDGELTPGVKAGVVAMEKYAGAIGAEYIFEFNPRWQTDLGKYSPHYGAFKPLFDDRFDDYDYILFVDTDVIPTDNCKENIFEQFYDVPDVEVGICEEWMQPEIRRRVSVGGINSANDNIWANSVNAVWSVQVPRTDNNLVRIFNSGVVVYSKAGRLKAQQSFVPFNQYKVLVETLRLPAFYTCDQPYLHAMLGVCKFNYVIMDYKWNSVVCYEPQTADPRPVNDYRDNANFVHVMLNGKHHFDHDKLWRVANNPVEEW